MASTHGFVRLYTVIYSHCHGLCAQRGKKVDEQVTTSGLRRSFQAIDEMVSESHFALLILEGGRWLQVPRTVQ